MGISVSQKLPIFDFQIMSKQKNILNFVFVILFIVAINTVQTYVLHIMKQFGDIDFFRLSTHIFGIITCVFSLFSTVLAWKIISKKNIRKVSKILAAFFLSILIFALSHGIYYGLERLIFYGLSSSINMFIGNFVFSVVIFHLYISGLTLAYFYFRESAKTAIELQQTEKEKELLQHKILQKNLEPHFLFNNLSILSGLVKKEPQQVEGFIDNFSDVYRYYLNHSEKDLVSLKDELVFLEKYISLMKKRFGNAYSFEINANDYSGYILPCALQLCVENAIKHNRGSEENPLKISVERNGEFIAVKNDFKPVDYTKGSGLGNQFLEKSYEINFGKKVNFIQTENQYTVEIPVI